jgi:2-succinyl-6-hydroxy-2,4-cyclohexadiene-1-carboxylate synthase
MLLLHGLASNARFWDLSAPHLTEEFRVLALDLRGHGASAKPEDGYDFPTVAADIAAFIQTLALERPLLVGHSWGANVGVQVAADYSGVLTGLVCIDGGTIEPSAAPGATWEDTEQTLAPPDFAAMRLPWEGFLDRARSGRMGALWGDRVEGFLRANFEILPDGTILPYLRRERHMRIVRALWDQQVSNLFPRVACPVLLMPARREEETRTSAGTREEKEAQLTKALELLPQARLVWMEDSIHDVPVQRPVEVARVIRDAARKGFFGK